jgi:hypothetical protein
MSTTTPGRASQRPSGQDNWSGGAAGVLAFAGIIMVMAGCFQFIEGLVAVVNDTFFVVGEEYVFEFDATTWGWIHMILGVIVALAGIGLFRGAVWARTVAVVMASLSILTNFLWMPYYPVWSLVIITFGVFVIWAAIAHGRDLAETTERGL